MLLVGSASVLFYRGLPSELAPMEDQGTVMVFAIAPEGATLDYLNSYTKQIDDVFKSIPEMQRYMMIMGRPTGSNMISYTSLSSWHERERTSQQVAASIMPQLMGIPGIRAFAVTPQSLGGSNGGGMAINFVVQTSESYQKLDQYVAQILSRVADNPALVNADSDLKLNKPELKVDVNRDKVAAVGASVVEIGRTLETMLGGRQVTRFKRNAEQYNVKLQVADVNRRDPDDLTNIYVRGGNGEMIQLSNLVTVREDVAPRELNHFNKQRAAVIIGVGRRRSYARPGARRARNDDTRRDGADRADRLRRCRARVQRLVVENLRDVPARARVHLSGAGRAVREFRRTVRHHPERTVGDGGRVARAEAHGRLVEHLQSDRT